MHEKLAKSTKNLLARLEKLGYSAPLSIKVAPREGCRPDFCWVDVATHIERAGGKLVSGWMILQETRGRWWMLEPHAIWEAPGGELIDPTPKRDADEEILFIPELLIYSGFSLPPRYIVVDKSKDVRRFIELKQQLDQLVSKIPTGQPQVVTDQQLALLNSMSEIANRIFA